jgi:hypothetical protein
LFVSIIYFVLATTSIISTVPWEASIAAIAPFVTFAALTFNWLSLKSSFFVEITLTGSLLFLIILASTNAL